MSPYGGMFVEQSKFLPRDSGSQCNMDVSRQSHGSLIFLAFVTRRLVEQGHDHISGMGDPGRAESAISNEHVFLGRPEYVISSESVPPGEPKEAILSGSVAPGEPTVAPGEPKVAPREPGERFPRILYICLLYFRLFQPLQPGGSVKPKYKPNI